MTKKLYYFTLRFFFTSLVLLVKIVKPLVLVRFGFYRCFRIGSMVGDLDVTLTKKKVDHSLPNRILDVYIPEAPKKNSANSLLTKLWRRSGVFILAYSKWSDKFLRELNIKALTDSKLAPHLIHGVRSPKDRVLDDRDLHNITENFPPNIWLKSLEYNNGNRWLESLDIEPDAKVALLLGRDTEYGRTRKDVPEYHMHRNCDINRFDLAAKYLVEQGYYVFRMGSLVKTPFEIADENRIFDYAVNGMRTEFRDIFLANRCTFVISVSSGYDALPTAFRKPKVIVNYPCIGTAPLHYRNSIILCKVIKDTFTHETLTIDDLFQRGVLFEFDKRSFDRANCFFVDNSSLEIQKTVTEAEEKLIKKSSDTDIEDKFQFMFRQNLKKFYANAPSDIKCEINARYSQYGLQEGHFKLSQNMVSEAD